MYLPPDEVETELPVFVSVEKPENVGDVGATGLVTRTIHHPSLVAAVIVQAEDEAVRDFPALATKIRAYRGKLIAGDKEVNLIDLIEDATKLAGETTVNTAKF